MPGWNDSCCWSGSYFRQIESQMDSQKTKAKSTIWPFDVSDKPVEGLIAKERSPRWGQRAKVL